MISFQELLGNPPTPCWGTKCTKPATRFFVSQVAETPGVKPANRAVCDTCYTAYDFDHFVNVEIIREVTAAEWKP